MIHNSFKIYLPKLYIQADEKFKGYLIDEEGKIVGETKNFDPYSKQGDIMMYEIDAFGFTNEYLKGQYSKETKFVNYFQDILVYLFIFA